MKYQSIARLEAEMRQIPIEAIEQRVEEGIVGSVMRMDQMGQENDYEKVTEAMWDLALFAVAQYELEGAPEHSPYDEPRWNEIARLAIENYVGDDQGKQALKNTPFFRSGFVEWDGFSHEINAKIVEPWSTNYEGRDFAAAVVLGGIVMMSERERFTAA